MEKLRIDAASAAGAVFEAARAKAGRGPVIAAVDGRCGSGKTTLAKELSKRSEVEVVHMDDFFLRPHQRTPQRFAEPGGNVDRERFLEEVLLPLSAGAKAVYRPYEAHSQTFLKPVTVEGRGVVVIEGSYSCHPALWDSYDLHIFLDVDPEEQLRRIGARNGPEKLKQFQERWIPLEEAYFASFPIEERCELRFELA